MFYSTSKFCKARICFHRLMPERTRAWNGVLWTFCVHHRHPWIHPEQDTAQRRFNSPALAAGSVTRPPGSELQANTASACLAQSHLMDRLAIVRVQSACLVAVARQRQWPDGRYHGGSQMMSSTTMLLNLSQSFSKKAESAQRGWRLAPKHADVKQIKCNSWAFFKMFSFMDRKAFSIAVSRLVLSVAWEAGKRTRRPNV